MADVYQFSQSSLELLELCIAAASQPGTKWIELFKPSPKEIVVKKDLSFNTDSIDTISIPLEGFDEVLRESDEVQTIQGLQVEAERIAAILEGASNKLDYLTRQNNYEQLVPTLAEKLTLQCVERICEELLNSSFEIKSTEILLHLFPAYIKRETSSMALNLLINGYKTCPDRLIALMEFLFTNTDIPNKLLGEFFIAVDEKACSKFLQAISITGLSTNVFIHHLSTINCLYQRCLKTFEINNFILNSLMQAAEFCQEDKNYGRFLLTFFQGLNENDAQSWSQPLEQLLNSHKTQFKRPCQAIFNKLLQEN